RILTIPPTPTLLSIPRSDASYLPPPPLRPLLLPYTTLFRSTSSFCAPTIATWASCSAITRSSTSRRSRSWKRRCGPRLFQLRDRSEEHTSELQSRVDLVCRLLLEKKKNNNSTQ